MIYVSSSCSKQKRINAAVLELAEKGFRNIELSGGTEYYDGFEVDLSDIKEKYSLNYLLHNYFPPHNEDFVLNLASLDDKIFEKSLQHVHRAIELSIKWGSSKYALHAGYYINIGLQQIGKAISKSKLGDTREAFDRFCYGYNLIKSEAKGIEIYIENNVYSQTNSKNFGNDNPLMLTSLTEYRELQENIDFKLLLDVAHLYVSSNSFDFDFNLALEQMIMETDYIHLSENDGKHDQNLAFNSKSEILARLSKKNLMEKTITLEIYSGIDDLKRSFDYIEQLVSG
jgi:sugar phosphate isomerase/epimerase